MHVYDTGVCCSEHMNQWRSKDNFEGLVPSFHLFMDSGHGPQLISLAEQTLNETFYCPGFANSLLREFFYHGLFKVTSMTSLNAGVRRDTQ